MVTRVWLVSNVRLITSLGMMTRLAMVLNNWRLKIQTGMFTAESLKAKFHHLFLYNISVLINVLNRNLLVRIVLLLVNVSWLILLLISGRLFLRWQKLSMKFDR